MAWSFRSAIGAVLAFACSTTFSADLGRTSIFIFRFLHGPSRCIWNIQMSEEVIDVKYSHLARISFWVGIGVEFFFGCVFLLFAGYVFFRAHSFWPMAGALLMCCLGILVAIRLHLRLKYRHVLGSRYDVSRNGILAQVGGSEVFVEWDRFARAQYLPLIPLYRLWSNGLLRPIIIFETSGWGPGKTAARRSSLAETYLREGLKTRLETRWLPW